MLTVLALAASTLPLETALLPLPPELRASATIVSFEHTDAPSVLRAGSGVMVCRRVKHPEPIFDARCYHRDFMPAVFRAWALRKAEPDDARRTAQIETEIASGKLKLLREPSAGYRMYGPIAALDRLNERHGPHMARWQSIHFPFRTASQLGLPDHRVGLMPYVMAGGGWWSHVMINDDGKTE